MKVLTGRFKGRLIAFKPEPGLRPTADKVRKAIIDTFSAWIEGKRVLDLYSGTGAFGFELLSAGAASVVFLEKEPVRSKRIQEWLIAAKAAACRVITGDVTRLTRKMEDESEMYDLLVLDPPYDDPGVGQVLSRLEKLMSLGAFLVYECRARNKPPDLEGLEKIRDKIYGDTRLVIYKRAGE